MFTYNLPSVKLACELRRSLHERAGLERVPHGRLADSKTVRAVITPLIISRAHSISSSGSNKYQTGLETRIDIFAHECIFVQLLYSQVMCIKFKLPSSYSFVFVDSIESMTTLLRRRNEVNSSGGRCGAGAGGPGGPGSPAGPGRPGLPSAPLCPFGPTGPSPPGNPAGPISPLGPAGPIGPCKVIFLIY